MVAERNEVEDRLKGRRKPSGVCAMLRRGPMQHQQRCVNITMIHMPSFLLDRLSSRLGPIDGAGLVGTSSSIARRVSIVHTPTA